jgi:replicative DNA helicase
VESAPNFALPARRRSPAATPLARLGLWAAGRSLWTAVRPVWDTEGEHLFCRRRRGGQAPGIGGADRPPASGRREEDDDAGTCGRPTHGRRPAQPRSLFDAAVTELATRPAHVPPQNLEAEESVLGAMLLSPTAIGVVTELLDASDFYRESHAIIYRAALSLWGKGEPVDAITLVDELDGRGQLESVGGSSRIAELAALVPATSNVEHYARIVREMATLRGLVRAGAEIARLGQERPGETADLVDRAEQLVFELAQQRVTGDFAHIETLLKESFERITHLYEVGADITGVPSGFRELDMLTSGFQPGNLIILAARPSMGKSALALCTAANLGVRHETPVALFTLEMSKTEVTQRLMCSEAKVESQRLRSGKLAQDDWPRLTAACDRLMKAPIFVDDTGSITMMELRSKARRLKSRQPDLGLIVVDYLQLMTTGASVENRVQEVSQISRQLKVLARDLEVPILALSQLSRAVEQRHDKRPILSDLRESGSIEQDADLVAFVYRDEYYNGEESEQQGLAEVILAKHRNGPTDTVKLSFLKRYAKFTDLAA